MDGKNKLLVLGNSLGVIFTIIVNSLAIILPLNGKTTSELSDAIPNLFVPAVLTFSIWSIIYLFLIIFMIYQILDIKKGKSETNYIQKIGIWFIVSCLANILWIFLWQYQFVTYSLFAMLLLLFSLIMIYLRLEIGLSKVSLKEKLAIHTTISIYLGWITVATIANITAVLVNLGADGLYLGEVAWTILVIIIAGILTVSILINRKDIAYGIVIIWALLGIVIKRLGSDPVYGVQTGIATTAAVVILIITGVIIARMIPMIFRKKDYKV